MTPDHEPTPASIEAPVPGQHLPPEHRPSGVHAPVVDAPGALAQDTIAIRAGRSADGTSLAPVLWSTSTFVTPTVEEGRRMATSVGASTFYTRYGNPTVNAFEEAIAELEGAEAARAFSSGMGAIAGVVLGLCSKGDHIVTQHQLYAGTQMLLQSVCPRFGIEVTFVDGADPEAWEAAVVPGRTMLLLAETPANPRLDLVDLARLGAIAGPMKAVDSTFATPL
ncbi:MAG: PLP-dependent transferase, partial [Microthrixaceae bacterium]